jgi:hypothetical protein
MLTCIYRDLRGGLWIGGIGLWERKGDAFAPVPLPPVQSGGSAFGREIQAVAREWDGGLWVAIAFNAGVFRRRPGRGWEQFVARPGLERSPANVITTDSSGRTWLGYQSGELVLVVGDSVRLFGAEQGLDVGRVLAITVYGDRVWIGGQSGVAAFDPREADGRGHRLFVPMLTAGEPLRGVSGLVQTADVELWLNGADGVTRIPAAEVRRALAKPGYQVRYERLDYRRHRAPSAASPSAALGRGRPGRPHLVRLRGGVAWVDPQVRRNPVPPPISGALTAGRAALLRRAVVGDTVRLRRARQRSAWRTAYSLAVPDRVRFSIASMVSDTTGRMPAGARDVHQSATGRYRFHVIASNDDGVWKHGGAPRWPLPSAGVEPDMVVLWPGRPHALLATPALAAVAWRAGAVAAERPSAVRGHARERPRSPASCTIDCSAAWRAWRCN